MAVSREELKHHLKTANGWLTSSQLAVANFDEFDQRALRAWLSAKVQDVEADRSRPRSRALRPRRRSCQTR